MNWKHGKQSARTRLTRLKMARLDLGLSRPDVMRRLWDYQGALFWPISESTLRNYEAGSPVPDDRIKSLCKALRCSKEDLT